MGPIYDIHQLHFLLRDLHYPVNHYHVESLGQIFYTMDVAGLVDLANTANLTRHINQSLRIRL